MNERALQIAKFLLQHPGITIGVLKRELHLTRRQINYSIEQLNERLEELEQPRIRRYSDGTFRLPKEFTLLIAQAQEVKDDDFIMDTIDRQTVLIFYLFIAPEYISLQHLIELLSVTKNTVLNDIKQADAYLNQHHQVTISYSRSQGYQLIGHEQDIRRLLVNILQRHSLPLNQMMTKYWDLPLDEMRAFVHQIEKKLQLNYSDTSFELLVGSFSAIVKRVNGDFYQPSVFFREKVNQTIDYQVIEKLVNTDWQLTQDDKEWLTLECLAANTVVNNATIRLGGDTGDIDLKQIVHQMVIQFQNQTLIQIPAESKFERRLINHLRPACFRIRFGFNLHFNDMAALMPTTIDHKLLRNLLQELLVPLEEQLHSPFPNEEVELLTYYFGSQLMTTNRTLIQKKAVVVCNNGLVTAHILREKMAQLFPELEIVAAISVRQFQHAGTAFDLVFTTVPLNTALTQYVVSPMISYEQQINLRYRVLQEENLRDDDKRVDHLMALIDEYADIHHPDKLRDALQESLILNHQDRYPPIEDAQLPSLTDYLKPDFVQRITEVVTWSVAVQMAATPLLEHGIVDQSYVDTLIEPTNQTTDYSFLNDYFSIPHALFTTHGIKEGIALAIFPRGVIHPNGECVYFIAPIAIYNLTQHFRGINELAALSEDEQLLHQLLEEPDIDKIRSMIFK
ncbi:MAG: PTS sugar transporter subunit IIA [Aerococcus sp.]|nr:PTS sugar transporter subunit IIA [Aerococcus sp.]